MIESDREELVGLAMTQHVLDGGSCPEDDDDASASACCRAAQLAHLARCMACWSVLLTYTRSGLARN